MNVKNFFTRVTVVILACLLIFMGVGSLLSDGSAEKEEVARVGKEVITLDEYKLLYQNYIKQISNSDVTEGQIKKLKYDLLDALVEQKLLINLTQELGLVVGEESIKRHIKDTKYFQNDKGEFDKDKFNEVLRILQVTEKEYISKLEKILPAMMLMASLFKDNYPVTFGEKIDKQIYKSRYQTRIVDVVKVTKDVVTDIPEPDDSALLDLYEKNKSTFHYPEYRTAQYISLNQKYFEDQIKVSDEEVDNIINQQELKDQRDILNLILHTKEEAEVAKKAIEEGEKSFEQVVEEFSKAKIEDIRINNITKDFLPENMRKEILALKAGEVSSILTSNFGWHIIKVENAHQISNEGLTNLKKDIKSALIGQKSFEKVNDFINQANYKIYNGATIEEISTEYKLPIQTIGPVDANEKDQNGEIIQDSSDLIAFIFSRGKDQKSYFKGVGEVLVSVKITDIIPFKLQSFEESKQSVKELWRKKFIEEKMFKFGQKIAAQIKEKGNFEKIKGMKLVKDQRINHNEVDQQNYPFSLIEEIFNMKTIGSVTSPIQHNSEVIIGILRDMHSSDGKLNTLDTGKRVMISLKEQLIGYLESKYKVEVNHAILSNM